MAAAHIAFNDQNQYGSMIRTALGNLEKGLEGLLDVQGAMQMMIDGDGSQAAHFALVTTNFGFASDAVAKAGKEELDSLLFKLSTNSSVIDVNAAMLQAFNKFR